MAYILFTEQMRIPFSTNDHRGVRLEDVKRQPKVVMPQVAEWMGISDHPSLYESSFCGLQYWGPASKTTEKKITGFDTAAIDRPVGKFFGPRDITIFETLFWPYSHLYGYTEVDKREFEQRLKMIRPWLEEPLEFEQKLYSDLPDHTTPIQELGPYKRLHSLMLLLWKTLDRDGTYQDIIPPLTIEN